jgi:hypothetical protein
MCRRLRIVNRTTRDPFRAIDGEIRAGPVYARRIV